MSFSPNCGCAGRRTGAVDDTKQPSMTLEEPASTDADVCDGSPLPTGITAPSSSPEERALSQITVRELSMTSSPVSEVRHDPPPSALTLPPPALPPTLFRNVNTLISRCRLRHSDRRSRVVWQRRDPKCNICLDTCPHYAHIVFPCCGVIIGRRCVRDWFRQPIALGKCPHCRTRIVVRMPQMRRPGRPSRSSRGAQWMVRVLQGAWRSIEAASDYYRGTAQTPVNTTLGREVEGAVRAQQEA